jgi:glycosyltransferase involved in cell wall biosynthesis
MTPDLVIIIPAYREAATIGAVVAGARGFGRVIVVDDNSPDQTGEVARANGADVVRNSVNLGYEGSIGRGFEEAAQRGARFVVTIDADGEHDPKYLAEFRRILLAGNVPLVIGIRPKRQRLSEVIMGYWIWLRFGVSDILCGMKGYNLDLWQANGGFDLTGSIGTELAINSIRRGARFEQVHIDGVARQDRPRFDSLMRANWRIMKALLRVLVNSKASRHPIARRMP